MTNMQDSVAGSPLPTGKGMDAMSQAELIQYASDALGLSIDSSIPKEKIIEELSGHISNLMNEARRVTQASAEMVARDSDTLARVRFINMQNPNADQSFRFDSNRPIGRAKSKNSLKYLPKYHLYPNQEYDLPWSVIDHLNSLVYYDNQPVFDPVTGQIAGNRPVIRRRFIVEVVLSDEQKRLISRGKPKPQDSTEGESDEQPTSNNDS